LKNKVIKRIVIYSILLSSVLIDSVIEQQNNNFPWFFIGIFCCASGIYIASYIGLKLGSIKLDKESRLRKTIEKLHISGKEISLHICVVIVSLMIMSMPLKSSNAIVKKGKVEKEMLIRIEKEFGRTDVNSVLEIDGKDIITFSDNSKKIMNINNQK